MRLELLNYVKRLNLGGFRVDDALPRTEAGEPLYLKNPRRIYVDEPDTDTQPLINLLNGRGIASETTRLSVFFSNDAKVLSANYNQLVEQLEAARNIAPERGFNNRESTVRTSYENDMLVTEVELTYTKLK
jgi:hypothetical protein